MSVDGVFSQRPQRRVCSKVVKSGGGVSTWSHVYAMAAPVAWRLSEAVSRRAPHKCSLLMKT
jgi:hypothetical protein